MLGRYKKLGLGFGGHIDDHQHHENTGCGAIDKIPEIFEKMLDPEFADSAEPFLKAMLGTDYNMRTVLALLLKARTIRPEYFEKNASGEYKYKKKIIDTLTRNGGGKKKTVEKLVGDHREVALIVNHEKGKTFDRDRFSKDNDDEIQAFNYDFWRSRHVARKLYSSGKERKEFLSMRAMLAVATTMVLTNDSLKVIVRGTP